MAVRWGILGCAGIAEKFCASVSRADNAEVAAVGSRSMEKAEQFIAENCPGAKAYGSYQDLHRFPIFLCLANVMETFPLRWTGPLVL